LDPALLISIVVEFRHFISTGAIPRIIALLNDSDKIARRVGIDAVSNLSDHSKRVNLSCLTLLMSIVAESEFRPLIEGAIPQIITLLYDSSPSVRLMGADSLSKLAAQGKSQFIGFSFAHQCCS